MQDADACRPASHQGTSGDLVVPEWGSAGKSRNRAELGSIVFYIAQAIVNRLYAQN